MSPPCDRNADANLPAGGRASDMQSIIPVARSGSASGPGDRLLPGVARRKMAGHRWADGCRPGYCGPVPANGWTCVLAVAVAFAIAAVTTPAGVSGAVLLPPFQASVLDARIMAIAPTNLVYNIIATPGALYRYWRQGQTGGRLTGLLIAGTVPGVVAGCVIRAVFLPGMAVFDFIVAAVLVPLGAWLALARAPA